MKNDYNEFYRAEIGRLMEDMEKDSKVIIMQRKIIIGMMVLCCICFFLGVYVGGFR